MFPVSVSFAAVSSERPVHLGGGGARSANSRSLSPLGGQRAPCPCSGVTSGGRGTTASEFCPESQATPSSPNSEETEDRLGISFLCNKVLFALSCRQATEGGGLCRQATEGCPLLASASSWNHRLRVLFKGTTSSLHLSVAMSLALVTARGVWGAWGLGWAVQGGSGLCPTRMGDRNRPLRDTSLPGEHPPRRSSPPRPSTATVSPMHPEKGSQARNGSREEQEQGLLGSGSYLPTPSSMTLSCFLPGTSAASHGRGSQAHRLLQGRGGPSQRADRGPSEGSHGPICLTGRRWRPGYGGPRLGLSGVHVRPPGNGQVSPCRNTF